METSIGGTGILQKVLLGCGILAPLIYAGSDILAGKLLKGYNFAAQSMGELAAAGSPVRTMVVWLTTIAGLLLIAFGVGIWRESAQTMPRIAAGLLMVNAAAGMIANLFFPATYGVRPVFASTGVLISFVSVLSFVLAIVAGAAAFSGWFRIFSIAIPAAYILLAVVRFATAGTGSGAAAGTLIGTQERTMSYTFLVWMLVLAVYLLVNHYGDSSAANGLGIKDILNK